SRIAERRARRFFHHVAERTGELQLAAAADHAHLDLEHIAAYRRVREACHDADLVIEGERYRIVWRRSQQVFKLGSLDARLWRGRRVARWPLTSLGAPSRPLARHSAGPGLGPPDPR